MIKIENGSLDGRHFVFGINGVPVELQDEAVVINVSKKRHLGVNFGEGINAVFLYPVTLEEEVYERERLSLLYETREERITRFLTPAQMEKAIEALDQNKPLFFKWRSLFGGFA